MLKIQNLSKSYDEKKAVDSLSLHIQKGEIYGFIGHNGAGKTTTLKACCGILAFEEGEIFVDGVSVKSNPLACKKKIAYIPDNPELYGYMKGIQYLNFVADIFGISAEIRQERIRRYADAFSLTEALAQPISTYSHGMKQKIAFMGALIHNPKVFILDEPMVGLDPYTASQVKVFFKQHAAEGNLVLFSSHNLDVVQRLCHRVYIIDQGRILEEVDMVQFRRTGRDFERYFLSITQRVAKVL